jgi:hypothetical protein
LFTPPKKSLWLKFEHSPGGFSPKTPRGGGLTKFDLSFLTLAPVEPDDLSVVVYILVFDEDDL